MYLTRKSTSSGKMVKIIVQTTIAGRNHMTPLNIVFKDTSEVALPIANTFMPTGGVIKPISMHIVNTTPYQIGSNPSVTTTGYMMGTVNRVIPTDSIMHPKTRYPNRIIAKIIYFDMASVVTKLASVYGILLVPKK
jgi:hypothetical protein